MGNLKSVCLENNVSASAFVQNDVLLFLYDTAGAFIDGLDSQEIEVTLCKNGDPSVKKTLMAKGKYNQYGFRIPRGWGDSLTHVSISIKVPGYKQHTQDFVGMIGFIDYNTVIYVFLEKEDC